MAKKSKAKSKEVAEVAEGPAKPVDGEIVDAPSASSAGPRKKLREVIAVSQEFSGPYPPPEILAAYKEIDPKLVDAILKAAELEQSHRHALDNEAMRLTEVSVDQGSRGQHYGFIISMTAIVGGIGLIAFGKETEGLVSIVTALGVLAGVFVLGKAADLIENWKEKS